MNEGLKRRVSALERSFRSPLSIHEMCEIAKELGGPAWSSGDSYYYGIHCHGRTNDGASIQICEFTSSEAVYDIAENRTKSMEQLEEEYGFSVEISLPNDYPDAAATEFLDLIEQRLFPAIRAQPMERFRPFGR